MLRGHLGFEGQVTCAGDPPAGTEGKPDCGAVDWGKCHVDLAKTLANESPRAPAFFAGF